ncbi:hypothetical protein M404DRAFT_188895 [Pisolithus tinctorius Marx 270]|uniref:Uncharacterized protein n=1 Tax=Pisolithus tinctorius Marx 270 TaxID=870435 RepID=A0A0C3PZG6_PISTI|nr:hypothetical protein M404DRAFT_188895 [Pisolithus tinctorius Marx 270]
MPCHLPPCFMFGLHVEFTRRQSLGIQRSLMVLYIWGRVSAFGNHRLYGRTWTNSFIPVLRVIMKEPEPSIDDRQQLNSSLSIGQTTLQQAPWRSRMCLVLLLSISEKKHTMFPRNVGIIRSWSLFPL